MLLDGHIHMDSDAARELACAPNAEGAAQWITLSLSQLRADPLQNLAVLHGKALSPQRCFAFCGLDHPAAGEPVPDYLSQLRRWLDAGFDGLKLIETKPNCAKATGIRLDDEAFEPMFAYCERERIPILWHNGDPAEFWDPVTCPPAALKNGWAYTDGTFPPLSELYAMVERVLERHPKLLVTFAHFYFTSDDPAHAARMMERYPNVRFDLTPGTEMYEGFTIRRDFFRPFFLRYAQRIQYGTDTDVTRSWDDSFCVKTRDWILRFLSTEDTFDFWNFHVTGYGLPRETVEQITSGTFRSFVGDAPRLLSRNGAREACRYVRDLLASRSDTGAARADSLTRELLVAVDAVSSGKAAVK